MTVQVTDAKEHMIELRFLMSAAIQLQHSSCICYVREKMIECL